VGVRIAAMSTVAAVLKQALNENGRSFSQAPADFVNKLFLDEWKLLAQGRCVN
jgi:hypothetical protein